MNEGTSTSRRLTRAEAKQQTRERLLAAAASVVARRGLAGASVDEIAETAGHTVGALYSQFGSKDKLLIEAMHAQVTRRVAQAQVIMEAGPVAPDTSAALGKLLAGSVADSATGAPEDALLFWTELWLHAARNPDLAELLAQEASAVDEAVAHSIRSRRAAVAVDGDDGQDEVSDQAMATIVSSLYRGLAQRRHIDPTAVPDELLGHAMQLLIAGRRATRATRAPDRTTETEGDPR